MMELQINDALRTFFLLHRKFSIPALGTLFVKTEPAYHDFSNNLLYPSRELLDFRPEVDQKCIDLFKNYCKEQKNISEEGIVSYLKSLKQDIRSGKRLSLEGIGTLSIVNNAYKVDGLDLSAKYQEPVEAKAVVHEGDLHDIKVGEDVRTNAEMKALLTEKKSKDYWWIYALILVLVAVGAILYYIYGQPK